MNPGNKDGPVKRVPPPPPPPRVMRQAQAPLPNGSSPNAGTLPKPPSPPPIPSSSHSSRVARPPPPPLPPRSAMKKPEPDSPFFAGADVDEIDDFFKRHPGPPPPIHSNPVLKPAGAQPGQAAAVQGAPPTSTQAKEPPQIPKKEEAAPAQITERAFVAAAPPYVQPPPQTDSASPAQGSENDPGVAPVRFDSIHVDLSEFEGPAVPLTVSIDAQLTKSGAEPLLNEFASLFSRLHQDCEGKTLEFSSESIFLDSRKIGDISINPNGFQAKIWLHELGYSPSMLPTSLISAIDREFRTFTGFIFTALKSSSYISLLADKSGERTNLRICFHKSMDSPASHSAPMKSRAT